MKALKLTLLIAVLSAALTSCTKQDLNEDDVLISPDAMEILDTGGNIDD
ncbi:hypothetical protein [Aestuariivivens sediminis]|nr:hypothetical protein [Aestuariivivens sediminis]